MEELSTWLYDPYFLNSFRSFGAVHEKTIKIGYDPFVHENEIVLHTGKIIHPYLLLTLLDASGFRLGVFNLTEQIQFCRQLGLDESAATDICGYEALGNISIN